MTVYPMEVNMKYKIIIFKDATTGKPLTASYSSSEAKSDRGSDRLSKPNASDGIADKIESNNHSEFYDALRNGNVEQETYTHEKYTDENGYWIFELSDKRKANELKKKVLNHVQKEWNSLLKGVV